jgi:hypothetical protein
LCIAKTDAWVVRHPARNIDFGSTNSKTAGPLSKLSDVSKRNVHHCSGDENGLAGRLVQLGVGSQGIVA